MRHILSIGDSHFLPTAQIIERILLAARKHGYDYKTVRPLDAFQNVEEGTIPMFIRSCAPGNTALAEYCRACNLPYIYYLDDDLWQNEQFRQNSDLMSTLGDLVANAFCVLVNSEVLAEEVRKRNPMVQVLPAFYDFSVLDGAEKDSHPDEVRIGFASNPSRLSDVEPLVPVIQRLLDCHRGKIVFEFAGVIPSELRSSEGVRYYEPIDNYVEFSKFQFSRGWDIGLAPLRPTRSNSAKTNNKYREYGACGIAGVYSDVPPYACVRHRHTGLLVGHSEEDWFAALSELINNPHLCKSYGQNARQDVHERFSVEAVLPDWLQFLDSIPNGRAGMFKRRDLFWLFVLKAWFLDARYGFSRIRLHLRLLGAAGLFKKMARRLSSSAPRIG